MSEEELSHLRGVNARLFADVRELQAENDRYRAALEKIAAFPIDAHTCRDHVMRDVAKAALTASVAALLERTGQ